MMIRLSLRIVIAIAASSALLPFVQAEDVADRESEGKKFAIVVGIENYDKKEVLGNLQFCVEDAREFAQVLKSLGYEDRNIRVLLGTDKENVDKFDRAGRTNINDAIDNFINAAGPKDSLILAFSGHGVQIPGRDGLGDRSYFCPLDGNPEKADTLIDLQGLYEKLSQCRAGTKLLFVDACQSQLGKGTLLEAPSSSRQDFAGLPLNTAAFFGCAIGHKSYESEKLKHGIFMYCVIEAFRSETAAVDKKTGDVTIDSLGRYLKEQVPIVSETYQEPKQTPTIKYDDPIFNTVVVKLLKYQTLLTQSRNLLERRDYDEALVKADKAVELGQQEYSTYLWRARLRENYTDRRRVINDATRAIELLERPAKAARDSPALIDLAIAYQIRGRNRHVEVKRNQSQSQSESGLKNLDERLDQVEADFEKCLATLTAEAVKRIGNEAAVIRHDALIELAEIARARKNGRLARQSFDDIPPLFGDFLDRRFKFFLLRVELLNDEGNYEQALKKIGDLSGAAEKLRNDSNVSDALVYQALVNLEEGRAYWGLGKPGKAIEKLNFAIMCDSRRDEAIELLGNIYLETRQFEEAKELFERFVNVKGRVEISLGLARALRGGKDMRKAMDYLDEALVLPGDGAPSTRARVLAERASLRLEWTPSDSQLILDDCNEAISLAPNLAEAYRIRAEVRQQIGDTVGADEDRRRAGKLAPNPTPVVLEGSKS